MKDSKKKRDEENRSRRWRESGREVGLEKIQEIGRVKESKKKREEENGSRRWRESGREVGLEKCWKEQGKW